MALSASKKSTIARSILRLGFRCLEPVAPEAAGRLAERLWFRLPARVAVTSAVGAPTVRELLGVPFEVQLRGRVVRGWSWGHGPVVYLVHGWGGTLEQMTPLVSPLLERGLAVVAFDGLSHGHSDAGRHGARSSDGVELGRALDAVAARFGPARAVVAHSMGALASVLAVRDGWLATERLVLVSPPTGIPDLLERFRAELALGERSARRLSERARRRTGYAVDGLDLATIAASLSPEERPELLVVHDLLDREVPHEPSTRVVRAWPGAQLLSTAGLGHRRILADAAVGGAVARFVDRLPIEPTLHGDDRPQPLAPGAALGSGEEAATSTARVGAA